MTDSEVIIQVGAEGGDLTLYGMRTADGWLFSRSVIDQSMLLLDQTEMRHSSDSVAAWPDALKLMDRYQWFELSPIDVHPEFRGMVLEAVIERYSQCEQQRRLPQWEEICGVVGGEPTICTSDDVAPMSSDDFLYEEEVDSEFQKSQRLGFAKDMIAKGMNKESVERMFDVKIPDGDAPP
jgi:hypothetical protein